MTHNDQLPEEQGRKRGLRRLRKWLVTLSLLIALGLGGYGIAQPPVFAPPSFVPFQIQLWRFQAHSAFHDLYQRALTAVRPDIYLGLWHQRAKLLPGAMLGDAEAQFQMGKTYKRWIGYYDDDAAHKWFVRAAENGHADAAIEAELYYGRLGKIKNYEKADYWAEIAARLDPEKYGERYQNGISSIDLSNQLVKNFRTILETRSSNPLIQPVSGTIFRDCPKCPEMVVVPGVDGGEPLAVSRNKISLAEMSACLRDSMCYYGWPSGIVPDDIPAFEPEAPITTYGTSAIEYSDWLFLKTGYRYRLPSLLEWEWIANADSISSQSIASDHSIVCQGWNEPGLGLHDWVGDIVRGQGPGVYPPPEMKSKPNPFGLCDLTGPLGELAIACNGLNCADSIHKHYDFMAMVVTKTADGDIVQLGRHYVGTGWFLTNYTSDKVDAGIRLVRPLTETRLGQVPEPK